MSFNSIINQEKHSTIRSFIPDNYSLFYSNLYEELNNGTSPFYHEENQEVDSSTAYKNFFKVKEKKKKEERVDVTKFILDEKEHLKNAQEKLKKTEIVKLYQKNVAVDLNQEKAMKERAVKEKDKEFLKSQSGILVNKKRS